MNVIYTNINETSFVTQKKQTEILECTADGNLSVVWQYHIE